MPTQPTHDDLIEALRAIIPADQLPPSYDVFIASLAEFLHPTPSRRVRFVAAQSFRAERTIFKAGDEMGTGTVTVNPSTPSLQSFEPAKAPHLLNHGRISAKLVTGDVVAEPIDDEEK